MKVGTDGVLLGAWTPVRDADRRVLDVGTGTGLIALMLAQRTTAARITALDVDPDCVGQARENANASPWGHRIGTVCSPVQEFGDGPFDLIVSNPPFYDNSMHSPDAARTTARHTASLPFVDLLDAVDRLLAPDGRFAVILPAEEARRFRMLAARSLWLTARTDVRTTPHSGVRRSLMLFGRQPSECFPQTAVLTVQTAPECFTPEYRALTSDFYLKF